MTLLIASILVALLGAGWVVHPILFRRWGLMGDVVPSSVVDSERRRRVALSALEEAEYDRASGKLDDEDYAALKHQLEVEAVSAIRRSAVGTAGRTATGGLHACGFVNPAGSRFCAGCGSGLL